MYHTGVLELTVPDKEVGCCLESERNGVSAGDGVRRAWPSLRGER
jgi:hypothetical protein